MNEPTKGARAGGARGRVMRRFLGLTGILALTAATGASVQAAVVMDQIGPEASFQQGLSDNAKQISNIYASAIQFDISVVDDFSLAARTRLDTVEAALFASDADTGFTLLTGLRVNVFSAMPTGANFRNGNLLSLDIPVGSITFTSPWTTSSLSRLASINLTSAGLTLNPGTYLLSIIALNNSFQTDIGVFLSSFAGTPGNDNARQIGSQLWGGAGDRALNADAAYRITGTAVVPVPPALAMLASGVIALGARRRRADY